MVYSEQMMKLVDACLPAIVVLIGNSLQEWGNDPYYILWSRSRLTKSTICGSFSSLCGVAHEFVEASRVNCSNSKHFEPLAFVSPDTKEQIVLEDISKGEIASGKAVRRASTICLAGFTMGAKELARRYSPKVIIKVLVMNLGMIPLSIGN